MYGTHDCKRDWVSRNALSTVTIRDEVTSHLLNANPLKVHGGMTDRTVASLMFIRFQDIIVHK